jgi:hypothetical protein
MQIPFPPPRGHVELPGPVEQAFSFCLVYLLLLSMILLVLPKTWMRRVIQIAFHLRTTSIAGKSREYYGSGH